MTGTTLAPQALDAHLYLAQSYLALRQTAPALRHAEAVLARQPELPAALGVVTLAHLVDGQGDAATAAYRRLLARDRPSALRLKTQAVAAGLGLARAWPE